MKDIYLKKLSASCDSDVKSLLTVVNDPEVEKFVNYMYAKNEDFVKGFLEGTTVLGIFDDSTHELVGAMHVEDSDPHALYSSLEIAYCVGKDYRNKGYCKSAINALRTFYAGSKFVCFAFYVDITNVASLGVMHSISGVIEQRYDDRMHVFVIRL